MQERVYRPPKTDLSALQAARRACDTTRVNCFGSIDVQEKDKHSQVRPHPKTPSPISGPPKATVKAKPSTLPPGDPIPAHHGQKNPHVNVPKRRGTDSHEEPAPNSAEVRRHPILPALLEAGADVDYDPQGRKIGQSSLGVVESDRGLLIGRGPSSVPTHAANARIGDRQSASM